MNLKINKRKSPSFTEGLLTVKTSVYNKIMKEENIISLIKSVIGNKYIGDDCAYLKDLGIVVSQDNLVEDIHFSLDYTTPYQLGYKSAMVNISDIASSGGICKYMTVALSLPKTIDEKFIELFYNGLKDACKDVEIIGGDITGSDKIMISVTVIGVKNNAIISSRSNAQTNQVVVTSGVHGSSSGGLELLKENKNFEEYSELITSHLMPEAQVDFGQTISQNIQEDYAMMDTSDGLADALYKIAISSNKTLIVDFDKILYDKTLTTLFPDTYQKLILYGGEDYQIIATVPKELAIKYNLHIIGQVSEKIENKPVIVKNYSNSELIINNLNNCFNHFK